MRKPLILVLGLLVALGAVQAGAALAVPNTQTITEKITPKALPKSGAGAAVSSFTDVSSSNSGNANQLPNATKTAVVDFDKAIKFQQKGFPTCDSTQFTSATTTDQAKSACGSSLIGGGTSTIKIPGAVGGPPVTIPAVVTAFNGAGHTVVLFTHNDTTGAQTLVGTLKKSDGGSAYGTELSVPVPPLGGGAAVITEFNTSVKKTYHFHGKKLSIVSANCKNKKLKFQARFTDTLGQLATGTDTIKCTQKKH